MPELGVGSGGICNKLSILSDFSSFRLERMLDSSSSNVSQIKLKDHCLEPGVEVFNLQRNKRVLIIRDHGLHSK